MRLEPLRVEHAEEMASLLDDPGLHVYIGGEPPSLPGLRNQTGSQAAMKASLSSGLCNRL